MKNYYLLLFVFFSLHTIFSQQQNSFKLSGKVVSDSISVENVHIFNKASLKGTISNSKGKFELPVRVGDTLYVSHINFESKELVISVSEKVIKNINILLFPKTHTLEEVTLREHKSIFYVDPQIMPQSMVNASSLKLPYANVVGKKDERIANISITSAKVDLENLINFFNGNTKKAKELKEVKLKDSKLQQIRKEFTDYFFIHQLKIDKNYINQFLNYCLNSGIIWQYKVGNKLKLTELLIAESKTFPHKQIDQDTLLSKQ